MKYLLHSRKLKSTLFKWLFCYIGTMLLFTVVVTYSRYITSKASDDAARTAKFNVTVSEVCYGKEFVAGGNNYCNNGEFRAKENNSFYFSIDTSELEVSALLVTTITLNDNFSFNEVGKEIYVYNGTAGAVDSWIPLKELLSSSNEYKVEGNNITITENISASEGNVRRYRVDARYKNFASKRLDGEDLGEVVKVGYSAKQTK